jgi:predicted nucleotide-binding protein
MSHTDMPRARILLADNSSESLDTWSKVLINDGYRVDATRERRDVLSMVRQEIYDLAVLDLHWEDDHDPKDMSGVEIAREVSRYTPCIFLTGEADVVGAVEALRGGLRKRAAHDLVKKQAGPKVLLKAVEDAILPRVFVVHGSNNEAVLSVERCLERMGTRPIILRDRPDSGKTIIEKFEHYSNVSYAVVLLTPDDIGGKDEESPVLSPRGRQNVIFEMGFFFAKIHRSHVAVLLKEGKKPIERPSDYSGLLYIPMDSANGWQKKLGEEMRHVGIKVDISEL